MALSRHASNGFHANGLPNGIIPPQIPPQDFPDPFAALLQTLIEQQKHFFQAQQLFPPGIFAGLNGNVNCNGQEQHSASNGDEDGSINGLNALNIRKIMESSEFFGVIVS